MNEAALARIIDLITELERLFEQARDDAGSPAWREMQARIVEMQEELDRLKQPH